MAPRPHSRLKGNRRKDAAFDAMREFGFSQHMILETINELLEVYGEEGWLFIEDNSYSVLFEAILKKGEKEAQREGPSGVETSSGNLVPVCSNMETIEPNLMLEAALPNTEPDSGKDLPSTSGEGSCCRAITFNHYDTGREQGNNNDIGNDDGNLSIFKNPGNVSHSPPHISGSQPPAGTNLTPRRRPYYGWIGSGGDEEDLVVLRPNSTGRFAEEIVEWLLRTGTEPKRSRWDLKPKE